MKNDPLLPLMSRPWALVAMLLIGAALVGWELSRIRRAARAEPDSERLTFAVGMLARRAKLLVAGLILSVTGACLLLASMQVMQFGNAVTLLTIMIFSMIPLMVYVCCVKRTWLSKWLVK